MDRNLRDALLFAAGLLGTVHETVVAIEPREVLIVMFAAMMGLPLFLRSDERESVSPGGPPEQDPIERFKKLTLKEFEHLLEEHDRKIRQRVVKRIQSYPRTVAWVVTCGYVSSLVALAHL